MRQLKMLALAIIGVGAMTALLGAGSASATWCRTGMGGQGSCPGSFEEFSGTGLSVSSSDVKLVAGGSFTEECKSTANGEAMSKGAGVVKELAFTSCKGECKSAAAANLPYKVQGTGTGEGNGTAVLTSSGAGNPGTTLSECTMLGVSCTYATAEAKLEFKGAISPGIPMLIANGVALKRTAGSVLCPETGTWTAKWAESDGMELSLF
ncbi:MAG TPA: hypothetical protein VGI73_03050 [Solirubrobacterales bacterium]